MSEAPRRDVPKRLLVSGIGRSGTTLIYQQIAKLLLVEGVEANFRYEPYLWDIRTPLAKGNAFGMEQVHHYGLHVHLDTPLFLGPEGTRLHDGFLDHVFDAPLDADPARRPAAYLAKVIRGSGRLGSYLARFPDLRVVLCLRNPVDTINSSLGMFSFFGEEFHRSDRARFRAEMSARGDAPDGLPEGRNSVEWTAAWVDAFTQEALAVAAEHPGRVMAFCYEAFQADPGAMLERLQDFAGLRNEGVHMGLAEPAGPQIKATSLTISDLCRLRPLLERYRETVMEPALGAGQAAAAADRLLDRYAAGRFSLPVAGTGTGRMSPIQLRGLMIGARTTPHLRLVQAKGSPIDLPALVAAQAGAAAPAEYRPEPDPGALKRGRSFGAVVTNHNNGGAAVDAVLSCLNQTLPFDEIVVVDDRSTDGSRELLQTLAELYASVTLVALPANLGPSGARHAGISRLATDFVTQLDGDDLFWPTKNAAEARALAGDLSRVAFSDILLVQPEGTARLSTEAYGGLGREEAFARLLRRARQIPRDMTFARARYFEAGGYDFTRRLYEDWDFKLRLACLPDLTWHRAEGAAGTVYNRMAPGLSGRHPGEHARALALIFLAALPRARDLSETAVMAAYDAALAPFADRWIAQAFRLWLSGLFAQGRFDAGEVAAFAAARATHALSNEALVTRIGGGRIPVSRPREGGASILLDRAALAGGRGDPVCWSGHRAYLEVRTDAPAPGFEIELRPPPRPHELTVELAGRRHVAVIGPAEGAAPHRLRVPLPLEAGRSLLSLHARPVAPHDRATEPAETAETAETGGAEIVVERLHVAPPGEAAP
jgi:hypothetical protein